jgi:hypothetical protein
MSKKNAHAEPRTNPEAEAAGLRTPGVNMAGAKTEGNPVTPTVNVGNEMESVVTGRHILTGEPVVKQRAVKDATPDYNTDDRQVFTTHTAKTGWINGRKFNFKAGETIYLNETEYGIFKSYVTKVGG